MPGRVLLAISDSQLRRTAGEALRAEKIQSIGAEDGNTASGLLNALSPDVLVAEIALPLKDGFALCQDVRQSPDFRSLPVVLVDERFDAINRKIAARVGATVYLHQPFTSSELVEVVRRMLESKTKVEAVTPPPVETKGEASSPAGFVASDVEEARPSPSATQLHATETALEPYKPKGLSPRDKPRGGLRHRGLAFYAAALIVLLAGVALTIWLWPRPAGEQPSLAEPGADLSLSDRAGATAIQPNPAPTSEPAAEPAASAESSSQAESRPAAPPAQALNGRIVRGVSSTIVSVPGRRPQLQASQQEPRPVTPATAVRPEPPAVTHRPPDTPAARPPATKSNPNGNQWQRAGQEITAAGEHFASGVKHAGKGGAKFFLWLGRKVGSGFKQVGKTVKSAF